ncbi:NADH dehydrogenase (ubiquinone) 15 kDa subunit [Augochlora pura]
MSTIQLTMNQTATPFLHHESISPLNTIRSKQHHQICNVFAIRLAKCTDAYGVWKSQEKCKDLDDDLVECLYGLKRRKRVELMDKVRKQEMKDGKRDYLPPIRSDYI